MKDDLMDFKDFENRAKFISEKIFNFINGKSPFCSIAAMTDLIANCIYSISCEPEIIESLLTSCSAAIKIGVFQRIGFSLESVDKTIH